MAPQFEKTIDGIDFKFNCPLFPVEDYWEIDYSFNGENHHHRLIRDNEDGSKGWRLAADSTIPTDIFKLEVTLSDAILDNIK